MSYRAVCSELNRTRTQGASLNLKLPPLNYRKSPEFLSASLYVSERGAY